MNQPLRETPPEEIKLTDIKSAQVRTIFSAIPASLVTILINSTILAAILWHASKRWSGARSGRLPLTGGFGSPGGRESGGKFRASAR